MKTLSIGLAVAGLMLTTLLVGWFGFGAIGGALFSVGAGGFLLFAAWQLATMAALGVCWRMVAPSGGSTGGDLGRLALWPFVWGRMVRDSAGSCLPFSTVGGFVLGVRAAVLLGVAESVAILGLVIDLTAEFVAELLFAVAGLLLLLARSTDQALTRPIMLGMAAALAVGALVLWLRKGAGPLLLGFGFNLLDRVFVGWREQDRARADLELKALFGDAGRMALGVAGHLVGWFCKGVGNWLAFRLLGSHIDLAAGLAIEALLHALLIPAFLVPGYAGVQEAGYAGIGALFGVPPDISLGVSLLRRARDLALGVPILLLWQLVEMRRLHKTLTR